MGQMYYLITTCNSSWIHLVEFYCSEWNDMNSISILMFKNLFRVSLEEKWGYWYVYLTGYSTTHTQTHTMSLCYLPAYLIPSALLCSTSILQQLFSHALKLNLPNFPGTVMKLNMQYIFHPTK